MAAQHCYYAFMLCVGVCCMCRSMDTKYVYVCVIGESGMNE